MPSAPPELAAKFPRGDEQAFEIIDANFNTRRDGMIEPKVVGYKPTPEEDEALDYLWLEWDYGYLPT